MIAKLLPACTAFATLTLTALAATPALAAPVCGETPHIARLQREWADPHGPVMIAAHRGGHLKAPENSLAAVDEAIAAGADFIEVDVQVSSDGVPFIMHDRTVARTTDGSGKLEDMTYAQVRRLRLKGGDTPPPTLIEMLVRTCGKALVDLDMKTDRFAPVIAVVQALEMTDQVELFDADSDILRAARAIEPRLPVMTRLTADTTLGSINAGLSPVRIVHGDPASLTPEVRDAIRAVPARIWANALGDIDDLMAGGSPKACAALKALREQGANAIQTNYPALLRQQLTKCGLSG